MSNINNNNNNNNNRPPHPRLDTANLGSLPADQTDSTQPRSPAPDPRVAEELPTGHQHFGNRKRHTRRHDLGPKWHKEYSEIDIYSGRVLVIDFVKQDEKKVSMRKVAAQEIYSLDSLRKVYTTPERNSEAVLRVFHVQNAPWATEYLLRKFNIDNRDDLVGTDFGRYVRHKRPERRGGKPFLSGKTWKVQYDPWRGISKTSFGVDYLKHYHVGNPLSRPRPGDAEESLKMMELNCWDEEEEAGCVLSKEITALHGLPENRAARAICFQFIADNPRYGYDVYVQRISCYIQHKQVAVEVPTDPDIRNPYLIDPKSDSAKSRTKNEYIPRLNTLDNGNAILIFDNSHSNSIEDTLIAARRVWESRWRRLPFFLAFESRDLVATDDQLALQCSRVVLDDIWKAVVNEWDGFLDLAMDHVSILEDKIYEQPADETRAPELWLNSNLWLKVEKLLFVHIDVVKEMRGRLGELADDMETDETWLDTIPGDYDRLSTLVEEDLVKPTKTLISLLYQSVSIRDSRHSIQLGISMWRLSWITFIFLPLTFIVGFFGMNVDTFSSNPSIKWYFIASVPFMLCVLAAWYLLKHVIARQRQTPYQRGIYESFFHDMATENPALWSRAGPREYILPPSRLARFKWFLIRRWSRPEKTIRLLAGDEAGDAGGGAMASLGTWARFKQYLIRRWTDQIAAEGRVMMDGDEEAAGELQIFNLDDEVVGHHPATAAEQQEQQQQQQPHLIADGLAEATELLSLPATLVVERALDQHQPPITATQRLAVPPGGGGGGGTGDGGRRVQRRRSGLFRHRSRNSSGNRSSGILVEEEDALWLSERGREGKEFVWRSSGSRDRGRGEGDREGEDGKGGDGAGDGAGDGRGGGNTGDGDESATIQKPAGVPDTPQVIDPPD
ncbi:hypothetical protein FQN52_001951 [Onygenales sp. PD_12]|nr:hypothetical protein FQN52_001951 [Onygenales sp. PD_12]